MQGSDPNTFGDDDVQVDASQDEQPGEAATENEVEGHGFKLVYTEDTAGGDAKSEDSDDDDTEGYRF
jgi:hypothetical protein